MLEGLEATEIPWSVLNEELRYEAEFFQKKYLLEDSELSVLSKTTIGTFATVTDGPHGYHIVDEHSPIAMLTAKCARDWFSDRTPAETIAASVDLANKRSSLAENDIILSTRGTVGMCALVTKEALPANIDQDVARISWADKVSIRPEFVIAYLNSKFGQDRIKRYASGMVQQGLSLQKVRDIPIPLLSGAVQSALAFLVQAALSYRRDAVTSIGAAETILLRSLGLESWQTPEPLSYVGNSLDAFSTGRLDAEYFQPKYAKLIELIESTGQASPLAKLLQTNQRGKQPEYTENGLPVVNSKHVVNGEVRIDADNRYATSSDSSLLIEPGDVLLNGTGVGTIGRAAPYLHPFKAIPDNHVTILRPHKGSIDPVYLAVFLNSLAGQLQVEQRFRGSSGQIELYPNDIAQFSIWVAPEHIQAQVRQSVEASFQAKQRATQLLDAAKHAVEIAIEDSEAAALAYLEGINP